MSFNGKIYVHKNKINGKCYVGQTTRKPPEKRWGHNGSEYKKSTAFYNSIKKYGWDNFEHIILPKVYHSQNELNQAEKDMIIEVDSFNNGYNMTTGGDTIQFSKEVRKRISKTKKENPYRPSKEQREKMSLLFKGKKRDKNVCQKISNSKKGHFVSEETKEKLRNINLGNQIPSKWKEINQYDLNGNFIKKFKKREDIKKELGFEHLTNISKVCNGKHKTAYGFKWSYA